MKAKVSKGVVRIVWPKGKNFPYPPDHPIHAHIVNVPNHVKPGFIWNGKKYVAQPKPAPKPTRDFFFEELCGELGLDYYELKKRAKEKKRQAGF